MNGKQIMAWSLGGLAALTVGRWVGIAFMPTLLSYSPLLLLALSPLQAHLVLAATLAPMGPLVAVASLRRILGSALVYLLCRSFGDNGVPWVRARYPKMARTLDRVLRIFDSAGPLAVVALPVPAVCALAGATRMPAWVFLPAVSTGHVLWAYLTYRVGESLSAQIAPITKFIREHMLATTLVFITITVLYALVQRRRRRLAVPAVPEHEAGPEGLPPPTTSAKT